MIYTNLDVGCDKLSVGRKPLGTKLPSVISDWRLQPAMVGQNMARELMQFTHRMCELHVTRDDLLPSALNNRGWLHDIPLKLIVPNVTVNVREMDVVANGDRRASILSNLSALLELGRRPDIVHITIRLDWGE